MSDDCAKFKAEILASDSYLSREACNHIAGCPECETLASAWLSLKNVRLHGDGRTTPDLDFAIISRSDTFAQRHNLRKHSSFVTKIIYFTAVAACMLLVSWLILSYNYRLPASKEKSGMSWNSNSIEKDMFYLETNLEVVRRDLTSGEWRPEYRLINKQTEKLFNLSN